MLSSGSGISGGAANWSSGFLPTSYQGVPFRSKGDPILDVASPSGVDRRLQRDSLDLIGELNRQHLGIVGDPEIATRISSYEMAFRMQQSAPELMDLSGETPATLALYGIRAGPGRRSPITACWPAAWSSAGCGSSTSTTRAGTTTRTSPGASRRSAARPTAPPPRWCST